MTRRRVVVWVRRVLLGLLALTTAFLTLLPIGRYLARAAFEEGKILARRQPIADLIASTTTEARLRTKLQVVLDARQFAIDSLGLRAQKEFTTYSRLDRDTLVLVLSAAYRDSLAFRTWWFPVVGRVPYKGFFDFWQARREEKSVNDAGFDAVLRPAAAFSTLGWFNDPILPTTLALDSLELAKHGDSRTRAHHVLRARAGRLQRKSGEFCRLTRGRAVLPLARPESRRRCGRAAMDGRAVIRRILVGTLRIAGFGLQSTSGRSRREARRTRHPLHPGARAAAIGTCAEDADDDSSSVARTRLNTASVMARRIYLTDLPLFERVYQRSGGDIRATIATLLQLAREEPKAPYDAVRRYLGDAVVDSAKAGRD